MSIINDYRIPFENKSQGSYKFSHQQVSGFPKPSPILQSRVNTPALPLMAKEITNARNQEIFEQNKFPISWNQKGK
ncbi:hypothetical protein AYI70_g4296 [Smittium culicis]|uniref:Uncharacterized protein n=1 Tax=Smittium culicis TaxID=133412 RepID=A0A1R1XZZ6_9FUNG|nr:hypothetical protein AYI70_g4296 [Smittium culicis]